MLSSTATMIANRLPCHTRCCAGYTRTSFLRLVYSHGLVPAEQRLRPRVFKCRYSRLQKRVVSVSASANADVIDVDSKTIDDRLPVTILTGFLGSGKTTLLNTVLSQNHGRRVAIIENEFGAIDIDSSLIRAKESLEGVDVVESLNGCICCTVRADLLESLQKLISTKRGQFDHIIIETTGLADPRPIISIFNTTFIREYLRLDGVVTMVDAKNVERHLNEVKEDDEAVNEALEQIAYADRIVLNKIDLVSGEDIARLEKRVGQINAMASLQRAEKADVPVDYVLGVGGFDLDRVPEQMEASASHSHDHAHKHDHHDHHDHHTGDHSHAAGHSHAEPESLDAYHSHSPAEHDHLHEHHHDDSVSSLAFTVDGDLDLDLVNDWLESVLTYMPNDLYRYKGILSIQDVDEQYVFQGVHEQFEGVQGRSWGPEEKRRSQMVFIGRYLDDGLLKEGFEKCRAKQPAKQTAKQTAEQPTPA